MRYVIKNSAGLLFSGFDVKETKAVTLNGAFVGTESHCLPLFEAARAKDAVKFDTQEDAAAQVANQVKDLKGDLIDHQQLGGPAAFEGCTIQEIQE